MNIGLLTIFRHDPFSPDNRDGRSHRYTLSEREGPGRGGKDHPGDQKEKLRLDHDKTRENLLIINC